MMRVLAWVLFAIVFAPTIRWTIEGWMLEHGYWEHGPILCAVAGFVTWRAARSARAIHRASSRLGLVLLSLCLLVHVAGQALLVDGLSGLVLVPAALALVLALEGGRRLAILAPPILAFGFAIPLPIFVTGKLAYALKHFATVASAAFASMFGVPFEQDGARILVPGQAEPLLVGDACSGLRSLVALVALGYVFAFFFTRRRLASRIVIVVAAVPIALLANIVRITTLALVAHAYGTEVATGTVHDVSGVFVYVIALAMLFALDRFLPGREAKKREALSGVVATPPRTRRFDTVVASVLATVGGFALFLALSVPEDDRALFAPRVATTSERFVTARELEFPEQWYGLLGTRDVCWRRYGVRGEEDVATLDVTAIFQGSSWKSLHPPEVCLLSAGFEITESRRRSATAGGERFDLTLLEAFHANDQRRYLIAYVFAGEEFRTPSFLDFFVRSIPNALLRRRSRAVLLRLDVPWPDGVDRGVIEARIAAFYEDMLPSITNLLRT